MLLLNLLIKEKILKSKYVFLGKFMAAFSLLKQNLISKWYSSVAQYLYSNRTEPAETTQTYYLERALTLPSRYNAANI